MFGFHEICYYLSTKLLCLVLSIQTPCRNAITCKQGNANYESNVAQYTQGIYIYQSRTNAVYKYIHINKGENQCDHYLSVDNNQKPIYSYGGATWIFNYQDGELCDQTQQPRKTTIYYHCDEEAKGAAFLYNVEERALCSYVLNIHSPLACVPEDRHNAACQWKVTSKTGDIYYLDLSSQKGQLIQSTNASSSGYHINYSPCSNQLKCFQQTGGQTSAMMDVFNQITSTCEHVNAFWEDGRVQPQWNYDQGMDTYYFSFHYYNGEKCSNGDDDATHINWWCDPTVDTYKVVNASEPQPCHFVMNIASKSACNATEDIF